MFNLDALSRIPNLIYMRLHLVQVPLQALFALLVSEFDFFKATSQLFFLFSVSQVRLV